MAAAFADRLSEAVAERQSNLCLGLDPGPDIYLGSADPAAAATKVGEWAQGLIGECAGACVAVKPQLACFERLGGAGIAVLAEVIGAAHDAGLLVVADGKRGDVPHTATAYAEAMTAAGDSAPGALGADAFTANPLPGGDSLDALIEVAARAQAGVFALVRMSNPGAADFFDRSLDGETTLADAIAAAVAERADRLAGACGLSGLGAVVGATAPEHLARLRAALPSSIFLVPGVGAQGGRPADLAAALGEGPASVLFPVSRGISAEPEPAQAAARLRDELWQASS